MKFTPRLFAAAVLLVLLSACGGGGGGGGSAATPPVGTTPPVTPPVTPPDTSTPGEQLLALINHCEHPRSGLGANGLPYYDQQGTLADELKFLKVYVTDTYLWYRELPTLNMAAYTRPVDYFAALKTPLLTASGRAKDRFHFTYPTDVWEAMSGSGVELGYGLTWSRSTGDSAQRVWMVALVEPGSPAAAAGLLRGDKLLTVDGVAIEDSTFAGVAALNAGLFPVAAGETHRLELSRAGRTLAVSLKSMQLSMAPVQNVKVLDTASGKVGYLLFNDHNAVSERPLVDAVTSFKAAGVNDLVLDMRYNGGGYLGIASELAYMIAGPGTTQGKVFERLIPNDKTEPDPPQPFQSTAIGYVSSQIRKGTVLPYLGLKRVTVLTTAGTCSASESVINSLRGVDVEVNLIGGETCGKPYAFTPAANCGTTYFTIQVQGTNNKGFGDYADGFQPTCNVADDLTRPIGDPAESLLSMALGYRANGVCGPAPQRNRSEAGAMRVVRPEGKEISIRSR